MSNIRRKAKLQKYKCKYCKRRLNFQPNHPLEATIDHVVPKASGGKALLDNTVVACRCCNSNKGSMSEDEFKFILMFAPHTETSKLDRSSRPYIRSLFEEENVIPTRRGPMIKFLLCFLFLHVTVSSFAYFFYWRWPHELSPIKVALFWLFLFLSIIGLWVILSWGVV